MTKDYVSQPHGVHNSVCAVVVAYHPGEGFGQRLELLHPQVEVLIVVDNTPLENADHPPKWIPNEAPNFELISNKSNLGIAKALNQGLNHAAEVGCRWLLTLDQDSHFHTDMVDSLLAVATNCKPPPAIIGGNYFDSKRGRHEVPPTANNECLERKTVITSGCLIDTALSKSIGGFREDYFIDQVDHEFCLRMRTHGERVVISRKPVMSHTVGGPNGAKLPLLGITFPEHPPLRKYYITRNTIVTLLIYWKHEPEWCLRRSIRLFLGLVLIIIGERNRLTKVRAFITGLIDGTRRRMGSCQHSWLRQA